jgi:hypothetical protein
MKNKIIVMLTPVILSILVSLYLTFSGTPLVYVILSPINGCGVLLGLANLGLLSQSTVKFIIINIVLGILIFSLLYFMNKNFLKEFLIIGAFIGLITGAVGAIFKNLSKRNN